MDNRHQEYREEHAVPDAFPVLEENVVWVSQAILDEKESLCRLSSSLVGSTMEWVSSSIATGYCDPNFIGHCIELAQKALSKDSKTGWYIIFVIILLFLYFLSWFYGKTLDISEPNVRFMAPVASLCNEIMIWSSRRLHARCERIEVIVLKALPRLLRDLVAALKLVTWKQLEDAIDVSAAMRSANLGEVLRFYRKELPYFLPEGKEIYSKLLRIFLAALMEMVTAQILKVCCKGGE